MKRARSGFLGVRGAPALGVDGLAREQLAAAPGRGAALVEIAVCAGVARGIGRELGLVGLGRVLDVAERLRGRIGRREVRQIVRARLARQYAGESDGTDRGARADKETAAALVGPGN